MAQGVEPEPGPPAALTERIRTDIEKWRGVVAKAGIRARVSVRGRTSADPPSDDWRDVSAAAKIAMRLRELVPRFARAWL